MGKQIARLCPAVVSQLRSSTMLSNVAQIAEELVCNSLDACATKIEITIDGEDCRLKVEDNGCGISREDMTLMGERYATSKLHSLDELEGGIATLGFRGEALSSLSNVSLVEITSRRRGMPSTYRKILKDGATLSIGLSGELRAYGTTVVVRDMFYNQPVRRRLLNSRCLKSQRKISQSVKECVMRYLLIHPQVSFTVTDLPRKDIILHSTSAATLNNTICNIFGTDLLEKLQEIDYRKGHLRLTGFLSKEYHSHPSKALQYFYINRRYVFKTAIHKLINSYGGKRKSSLGQINFEKPGAMGPIPSFRHLFPVFVLNLTCPFSDYDITFEASKTLVEFQDWEPVVTFVENIILKIWGDESGCNRQGYCPIPESKSADHGTISCINGDSNHSKAFKFPNNIKDKIPPMAVRRALVHIDSPHLRVLSKDLISKPIAAATLDDTPEMAGTSFKSLVLQPCPSGKTMTGIDTFSRIDLKDERMSDDIQVLQPECGSDGTPATSPKPLWHMIPCRNQEVDPIPGTLASHWFSDKVLSPKPEEHFFLHSGSVPASPLYYTGGTSGFVPEKDQYQRSSVVGKRFLRNSSSPPNSWTNPLKRRVKKSRNAGRIVTFRGDDDEKCWTPDEWTQDTVCEKWWDPDSTVPETFLCSPSNGSLGLPSILSTSEFLSEVSSSSPERTRSGGHPSYEWKWTHFDSDHREDDGHWSSKSQTKRQMADYASDSDELTHLLPAKSYSFTPQPEGNLGSLEITKSDYVSCNVHTEDASEDMKGGGRYSDGTETIFQDASDSRIFSSNQNNAVQLSGHGFGMNLYIPRSKRRLNLFSETSSDILKLLSEDCEQQKKGEQGKVHASSTSKSIHIRRGSSGPPFYRPPKRHGIHINPSSSLSTVEKMANIAEDVVSTQIKPDKRSKIVLEAIRGTNKERVVLDVPQKMTELTELTEIQPGKQGLDCGDLSTKATPCLDQEDLEKQEEDVDIREVECPSGDMKSLRQSLDVDVHEHCKYRSTEVNNDGERIPVDTVKAMFKEWSNPCMKKDDDILDLSSGILASDVSSLLPESITKDVFKQARVLQQVDTKFIATISCGVLLLIDQHAADERVRLEELRKDVLGGNIAKQIGLLSSTQHLTITFTEQQTFQTYSQQIQDWGWRYKVAIHKTSATCRNILRPSSGGTCKVLLSAVPCILGVRLTGADLVEYVQQLTDTQGSSTPPPAVIRLLNNKACRGAIMFGDKLLPAECNQLVDQLKKTLLCFQCAHGRPTMIPLVDILALRRRFDPTFGSSRAGAYIESASRKAHPPRRGWHGLQSDVNPSVERARARLAQALSV